MKQLIGLIILSFLILGVYWYANEKFKRKDKVFSNHHILIERIESIGKLELVKYRLSDVIEHKNSTAYLPDASVLLIVKADAVGCIDLSKVEEQDIEIIGDSAIINLPEPEICYVKIDHASSKVYDTKMAFFREADLVDEAYKYAEAEMNKQVIKSDILQQTKANAEHVLKPLLNGLGYNKITLLYN